MESVGLVGSFGATVADRKLWCINFLRDDDSKAGGWEIFKLECLGFIQKKVGAWLRKPKLTEKGNYMMETSWGRSTLNQKMMNKLQNYFGLAIHQRAGKSVYEAKKSARAVLFHYSGATSLYK